MFFVYAELLLMCASHAGRRMAFMASPQAGFEVNKRKQGEIQEPGMHASCPVILVQPAT